MLRIHLFLTLTYLLTSPLFAQQKSHLQLDSPFASYVETNFPFFSQTLDARTFGEQPDAKNLTPRGIIIPAGNGLFGCFDPDLLRWSLIWKQNNEGEYLSMVSMGSGSYRLPNLKSPPGQKSLPKPIGTPYLALPLLPGIAIGNQPSNSDPRDRGHAEADELGLGPVPTSLGRFSGIRLVGNTAQIEYLIGNTLVREQLSSDGDSAVRLIEVAPRQQTLQLRIDSANNHWLPLPPSKTTTAHRIQIHANGKTTTTTAEPFTVSSNTPTPRWPQPISANPAVPPTKDAPWVFDDLPLPVPNPWKRNVRPSDLEFFADGRAALVTFDGDVWIIDNLDRDKATWRRFASGLHEPQSLCIVDNDIHVFDRNGIIKLIDSDGNGEADWYANVSNIVAQSAETRNYPMDMIPIPEGGFYLALGGQIGSTIGKYNGVVVQISADGLQAEVIATGFRQPYLGYDPETKILTASDQQGNWKPATPIYRVKKDRYFGFQPERFKGNVTHPAPITPGDVWIPHFINQSGASQLWIKKSHGTEPRMGTLNGALVHIGYNRPELFKIYLNEDGQQGAVMPLISGFPAGLLNGRINPRDGLLYVTGFQIFGSSGSRIGGIFRVRQGKTPNWLPTTILAEKRGVLLSFNNPLSPEQVAELGRYSADRWNYHQTHAYGSGNFRTDNDQPGQDSIQISSATLSKDHKSLFLGIRDMKPANTLRLTYRLPATNVDHVENAYLTIHTLPSFDLSQHGFANNHVDLTPRQDLTTTDPEIKPTASLGKEIALRFGCIACHATGDSSLPPPPPAAAGAQTAVGPPWVGLWNAPRTFTDGSQIPKVDAAYLRESILDPTRRIQEGYEMERTGVGMPSYLGVLKDHEIESIILYIQTLKTPPKTKPNS